MDNRVAKLIDKYETNREYYLSTRYNESQLRSDFLDPLFGLLGWDIKNESALPTNEREVVLEESLRDEASKHAKKPDYTFRLHAERKFFLEAKKPCIHIESEASPAIQVRRYGYTANLKVSVLSNFEYLMIYDVTAKIGDKDTCQKSLVKKYHYTEYAEKFDELCAALGREAVYDGRFDEYWKAIKTRVNHWSLDSGFLKQVNDWRLMLGKELLADSPSICIESLGDEVQNYINKILFLRVCEDRNIEAYKSLLDIAADGHFAVLLDKFRKADAKYNSGLFEPTSSTKVVCRASSVFWNIIRQLYYPESPYSFSVLSSDVLGQIYELFIAEKLAYYDGSLRIEKKPDYVDRDVVTTPTYIVREILRQTLLPLCQGKSAAEIFKLRVADIACGSGAFLLEAYQLLNDSLIDFYIKHDKSRLVKTGDSTYKLKFAEKRKILVNCLYGIDRDFNAVEACKFGLLLKLLENEDADSLRGVRPVLPNLDDNIHFGNSLLSSSDVSRKNFAAINPFDFGDERFDVIVGNPPYLSTEGMKRTTPQELPIYKDKYDSAYKQFDKYFLFVERAMGLLKENGMMGYIVPLKFMKVGAGCKLRKRIASRRCLYSLTSFGACQVFDDKSNYTCLLVLKNAEQSIFRYSEVSDIGKWNATNSQSRSVDAKPITEISETTWVLFPESLRAVYNALTSNCVRLSKITGEENIFNGIQTSANDIYVFTPTSCKNGIYTFVKEGREWRVEVDATRPYYKTSRNDGGLNSYRTFTPNACVIFPYRKDDDGKLKLLPLCEIKNEYPLLYKYLTAYKSVLASPKRDIKPSPSTDDEWHRFGRHQSLDACNLPQKIMVGVLSTGDKYAVDRCRTFVSSGGTAGYCMIALPEDSPYSIYYIQAILNSKYLEWFSSLFGEIFRGGFIARGTKVLKQLPVRVIDFSNRHERMAHDKIARLQKALIRLGDSIANHRGDKRRLTILNREFESGKRRLSEAIMHLYGIEELDSAVPVIKDMYAAD